MKKQIIILLFSALPCLAQTVGIQAVSTATAANAAILEQRRIAKWEREGSRMPTANLRSFQFNTNALIAHPEWESLFNKSVYGTFPTDRAGQSSQEIKVNTVMRSRLLRVIHQTATGIASPTVVIPKSPLVPLIIPKEFQPPAPPPK